MGIIAKSAFRGLGLIVTARRKVIHHLESILTFYSLLCLEPHGKGICLVEKTTKNPLHSAQKRQRASPTLGGTALSLPRKEGGQNELREGVRVLKTRFTIFTRPPTLNFMKDDS